jgi:NAD(P)H-dependent FMN reductase
MECTHYERMGDLPHFNPDLDGEGEDVPHEVGLLREMVERADALVISTPEYAHGLPGAFKNALDWLVSFPAFAGKPTVILQAARGSTWALDSLREILRTMSAKLIGDASISLPLGTNQMDEAAILARADLRELLARSVEALVGATS